MNTKCCQSIMLFLMTVLLSTWSKAQQYERALSDTKEDLVQKTQDKHSALTGKIYEIKDAQATYIFYFEIRLEQVSAFESRSGSGLSLATELSDFEGQATATLFNVLYSTDQTHFTRYVVDTLDQNSGCCPCHQPDQVNYLEFQDEKKPDSCTLFMTHPVRFDCNSMTSHYKLHYYQLMDNLRAGRFVNKAKP